ncbi:tyrosine-type recombinase/integrase [Enterococcus rivorum]|uniref:hypothetical protein n=1 Tax=Enterococcus rivorum TaxID=762845 RepID=UPI00363AFA5D
MAIKKMNNGKYKVNVYMGAGFSRFVAYADSKEEAMILEQEAKLQKLKGEFKKKKGDYTFKEVYEMWWKKKYIVTKHHEQSTLDRTKSVFRLHILPYLGDKKIKHVSFDILEIFKFYGLSVMKKKRLTLMLISRCVYLIQNK